MPLSAADNALLETIICDLVYKTGDMGPMLLYNAGYSKQDWQKLRRARKTVTDAAGEKKRKKLNKREIAHHIISRTDPAEIESAFLRLVAAASQFQRFDLSYDADVARAVVAQARQRLRDSSGSPADEDSKKRSSSEVGPGSKHEVLLKRFRGLEMWKDTQGRGKALEHLLHDLCVAEGIPSQGAYNRRSNLDQLDGGFEHLSTGYTVECKWEAGPVGRPAVDLLMKRMERSVDPNIWGMLLSINGWTSKVVPGILESRHSKNVVLMNGVDLNAVLEGLVSFKTVVEEKTRAARFHNRLDLPVSEIL